MGTERAAATGLTAAQLMDFWLWLWLGFSEREAALGTRSAAPGTAEAAAQLGVELAALEAVSSQLSAALRAPAPDGSQERTYSRLQGGLAAGSVVRLATWLEEPAAPAAARLRRRASEVLQQVGHSPAPSPARAGALDLWAWLTAAEADRRVLLVAAGGDRRAARQLSEELRLLQTVQAGVRRGQADVIPSHSHEGRWLGARRPFQPAIAADLARVLRRARSQVTAARGGAPLGPLIEATASRLEAMAGPEALATAPANETGQLPMASVRDRIAAGLAAVEGDEPYRAAGRFLGRPVTPDATRLGATLVDADLGDEVAWRIPIAPQGFDEAAEFSAAGAAGYELYLLVAADGTLEAIHQRIDRSPHGRRWFAPAPVPRWLHPQGDTLDVAWSDVAAPARARMLALLAALTGGAPLAPTPTGLPAMALAARRSRRSRH
jgi:hypothetical protein